MENENKKNKFKDFIGRNKEAAIAVVLGVAVAVIGYRAADGQRLVSADTWVDENNVSRIAAHKKNGSSVLFSLDLNKAEPVLAEPVEVEETEE